MDPPLFSRKVPRVSRLRRQAGHLRRVAVSVSGLLNWLNQGHGNMGSSIALWVVSGDRCMPREKIVCRIAIIKFQAISNDRQRKR